MVKTDLGSGDDFAENLAVDAQGRIVLVGRATSATILDMALVHYQPDGTLDTSFDGDGILTADFHGRGSSARTSRWTPRAGSSPPATPPTAARPSSPSCAPT
ncbi:MAG TPA: delta-60 repeat domain-containing protein [Solirubrobacteraceae bacterium]|nr:delta-60 repeat domain-containing protein [Solirubrobacteraceae bacterium]